MTKKFVKRIIDAYYHHYNAHTRAGYTYQYNGYDGCIRRIKSDDIGRTWIDSDGNMYDAWKMYLEADQVEKIMREDC